MDFAALPMRGIMARDMTEASPMAEAMAGDEVCEEDSARATAEPEGALAALEGEPFTRHGVPRTPRRMGLMR